MKNQCNELALIIQKAIIANSLGVYTVVDAFSLPEGIKLVVKDTFDEKEFEVTIKPITKNAASLREGDARNLAYRHNGDIGSPAIKHSGNGNETGQKGKQET